MGKTQLWDTSAFQLLCSTTKHNKQAKKISYVVSQVQAVEGCWPKALAYPLLRDAGCITVFIWKSAHDILYADQQDHAAAFLGSKRIKKRTWASWSNYHSRSL